MILLNWTFNGFVVQYIIDVLNTRRVLERALQEACLVPMQADPTHSTAIAKYCFRFASPRIVVPCATVKAYTQLRRFYQIYNTIFLMQYPYHNVQVQYCQLCPVCIAPLYFLIKVTRKWFGILYHTVFVASLYLLAATACVCHKLSSFVRLAVDLE